MPYPEFMGYTKAEIDDLKAVVKEFGDVDFSDYLTSLDEEMLRENKYFEQLVNHVQTRPLEMERAPFCEITIKLGKYRISDIITEICDCLFVPFKISIDFFAGASSPNRPLEIIHPSIGTSCNKNRLMRTEEDFENLYQEFENGVPVEKMLQAHSASRKIIVDSGLRITDILAMRIYISRYIYQVLVEIYKNI